MFRKKKEIFHVGNVEIIINESTLDVFRNTVYYVDMQNALCIKGVPFITCDIYEDEFSDHLIAQVGGRAGYGCTHSVPAGCGA